MKKYLIEYTVRLRKEMSMEIYAKTEEDAMEEFDDTNPLMGDYKGHLYDDLDVDACYITEDESYEDEEEDEIEYEEEK